MDNIIKPYIDTNIKTPVSLYPDQMNNNIRKYLLLNVEQKLLNKCYRDLGIITQIYDIDIEKNKNEHNDFFDNIITAEDTTCSAKFIINVGCQICAPIKNTFIVAIIDRINSSIIRLVNGPMFIIITLDRIDNNFFHLKKNNTICSNSTDREINVGDYVVAQIIAYTLTDNEEFIPIIGKLIRYATNEEYNDYF